MHELRTFFKSAQKCASLVPFADYLEEKITIPIRGGGIVLENKRSN
jgi:hypothetical protein